MQNPTTSKKNAKKNPKLRDLKPKKDANGGVSENISLSFGRTKPEYQP